MILALFCLVPTFLAQVPPSYCDLEPVASKLDILITQSNDIKQSINSPEDGVATSKEMNENFQILENRVFEKVGTFFPQFIILLIANDIILVCSLLILKRYGVI